MPERTGTTNSTEFFARMVARVATRGDELPVIVVTDEGARNVRHVCSAYDTFRFSGIGFRLETHEFGCKLRRILQ